MFENMGKKYNDIDDFRKPNESESRDVDPPEKSDKKEALVPFVEEFIKDVFLDEKKIIITPIEGLLWE